MTDPVAWLKQEVRDLLDVSSVGLYEFIWLQRGHDPNGQNDDRVHIAEQALRELLAEEELRLVPLIWPGHDPVGAEVAAHALRPSDWDDPGEGVPYIAVTRNWT